ncbi:MAG TPA: hypothetical protein VHL09_16090 [Dehalococcoidia bacterium]|nr:hypothetical protein [Dehalococcoidia bacterium]
MHDGIHVEKAGLPSATILTDHFRKTGETMARLWNAADYPVIYTPHPISQLSAEQTRARAKEIALAIVAVLTGA